MACNLLSSLREAQLIMYITIGHHTYHVESLADCEIFCMLLGALGQAGIEYWLYTYVPHVELIAPSATLPAIVEGSCTSAH